MKTPRGFTLIELLIVFSIVGLLAALVAPATGGLMDKARAQEEWLIVDRRVKDLAFQAFARGQRVTLTGRGAELLWTVGSDPEQSLELKHVFFEPEQTVVISSRGVATPDTLKVRQAQRQRVINLNRWKERG